MSYDFPDRNRWLAVRSSPSLGRLYRQRAHYVHISAEIERVKTKNRDGVESYVVRAVYPGRTYKRPKIAQAVA